MTDKLKTKPFALYILFFVVLFQALSGLFGGFALTFYPSGEMLNMPLDYLNNSPFNNYLIPGIILFVFLGILPAFLFYSLIKKPSSKLFELFNLYKESHWSWTFTLYVAIMLVIWIQVEIMIIGYALLQTVYGFIGIVMLIITLLPSVKNYYKITSK